MAAEQDLKLDQANPEEEAGGSKKKLIIIIVAVVLLIAIAVGATVFLMSGDDAASDEASPEEAAEVVEEVAIPAQYIKMKPRFIVNYNVGTRQRFLQASIEIMTRSQGVVDAVELHNPMLRNEIVRILSDQDFKALRTPEGRLALKNQLQEQLIALLKSEADVEGIEAILFTDFVMQ
jgi:flagellar FliL protein